MKSFSLNFLDEKFKYENEEVNSAVISIGGFTEKVNIPLGYWRRKDYEEQWSKAVVDLLSKRIDTAFITKMYNPKNANFLELWVLYLDNTTVHIQNTYLFLDELKEEFNEEDFYSLIPKREVLTEEGEKISEWDISIHEIEKYYKKISLMKTE